MDNHVIKNISQNINDFTFVLANRNYNRIGTLTNVDINTLSYKAAISPNEISFDIYKELDGITEELWNDITDFKLVWIKEFDEYFEIYVDTHDENPVKKTVTGTSLCEAELSQIMLYGIEINTEDDIARDDYKITTFYNMDDPEASLINRILSKVPHYKIRHVDSSLSRIQRSFSIDGTSIYDFLTGDCAEQFNCVFYFDSRDRSISVYDLFSVCKDCNHRDDNVNFTHVSENGSIVYTCPICGSSHIRYYGKSTGIYVDNENLTDSVQFTTDTDSVKNCFKLVAGDDLMTATVRLLNANGTDYIYYVTKEQEKDMSKALVDKIKSYDELYLSYTEEYEEVINTVYDASSKIYYYESSMMPTVEHATVTASTEASKLTELNLSPTALSVVNASTSKSSVENALKNYAKIYIKTGYVKLEINESSFSYNGKDSSGNSYGTWTGNFRVVNYSDKDDVAVSPLVSIKIYDNYEEFLRQKIQKNILVNSDDDSIFDVLSIKNLNSFTDALKYYGLHRLNSFYDAIQSALDVLVQVNQANESSEFYSSIYLPYYNKLQACQKEIDIRQTTVDKWKNVYDNAVSRQQEIQKKLNFENYIGKDLYNEFCLYRREDTYQNDNFISDGLEDPEIITRANEFIKTAQKELVKSATHQHSISTNLYDLMLIPDFFPLLDSFEIGNWIMVRVDESVYRLRLIEYTISFSDLNVINVVFSDVIKIRDAVTDTKSILESAKSMATNYSYISKQAESGNKASENIDDWVEHGLNSALVRIKNNDREEISYGKHGLLAREYDDISDDYSDEQLRFTHNILAFTEDNWETVSLGLGKHEYTYYDGNGFTTNTGYGISAKFCQAAYIYGSQIIGGDIYSSNYSPSSGTHLDLNKGTFSFAGGGLSYDGTTLHGNSLEIKSSSIHSSNIYGTNMYSSYLYSSDIESATITAGTINGTDITGGTITGTSITAGTITGADITGGIITSHGSDNGFINDVVIKDGNIYLDEARNYRINGNILRLRHLNYIGFDGCRYLDIFNKFKIVDVENDKIFGHWFGDVNLEDGEKGIYVKDDIYIKKKLYINGTNFSDYINKINSLESRVEYLENKMDSVVIPVPK